MLNALVCIHGCLWFRAGFRLNHESIENMLSEFAIGNSKEIRNKLKKIFL